MAMSPDEMVPSGPSSAGQQAVIAYLQSKGLPVNAGNIRRAVEANAREPGSMEANGPNLGPTVLNLRNAGIEDAGPIPARGGGSPNTSAAPTQVANDPPLIPTPTGAQPSSGVGGMPSMNLPPPIPGVTPGQPMPGQGMPPPMEPAMVPTPGGGPLPPPDAAMALPEPSGGMGPAALAALIPAILGGRSLTQLLQGPGATPALSAPEPRLALPAPAPQPQLAGPRAPLALPAPPPQLALPAPAQTVPPVAGFTPEYPTSPASAAIDKAIAPPPVQQASKVKGLPRGRVPTVRPPRL